MTRLFHKTNLIVLVLAVTWTPVFFPTHSASAAAGLGNPAEVEAFLTGQWQRKCQLGIFPARW